jgi:hypothetical protein
VLVLEEMARAQRVWERVEERMKWRPLEAARQHCAALAT